MNRQAKRMMAKQKATTQDRVEAAKQRRPASPNERRKQRVGTRDFLKQVRAELRKVNWPSRREVIGYTLVVLTTVVVVTSYVFGLDLGFSKTLLHIIQGNGG
jgi:preprotein translocase subunit SecE